MGVIQLSLVGAVNEPRRSVSHFRNMPIRTLFEGLLLFRAIAIVSKEMKKKSLRTMSCTSTVCAVDHVCYRIQISKAYCKIERDFQSSRTPMARTCGTMSPSFHSQAAQVCRMVFVISVEIHAERRLVCASMIKTGLWRPF